MIHDTQIIEAFRVSSRLHGRGLELGDVSLFRPDGKRREGQEEKAESGHPSHAAAPET